MRLKNFLLVIAFTIPVIFSMAQSTGHDHDGHSHGNVEENNIQQDSLNTVQLAHDSTIQNMQTMEPLKAFPTLHPLIVHIPIIFLMMAAAMSIVSLFLFKRELTWTAYVVLLIGFAGAYASSTWFHAHTTDLPAVTKQLLTEHEKYADYTIWSSGLALLIQSVNLFFLKRKFLVNIIVTVILVVSAIFVAIAGHHGAELVHKHGVGAKGHMLEQHHH